MIPRATVPQMTNAMAKSNMFSCVCIHKKRSVCSSFFVDRGNVFSRQKLIKQLVEQCTQTQKTMRLTPELIQHAPQFLNPVNDRELDLRGHKIELIENLGVTRDTFDTIDLSDNIIRRVENFPQMNRLRHLLLSNNRIETIDASVALRLPNLESLVLSNNDLKDLDTLIPLKNFKRLHSLSLLDNLVTKRDNYRLFVIYHVPSLKFLDFVKVKLTERQQAKKVFEESRGAVTAAVSESKTFTVGSVQEEEKQPIPHIVSGLTQEEKTKLKVSQVFLVACVS